MSEQIQSLADVDVVGYLLRRGAVTRDTAIDVGALPSTLPATWRTLLMSGVVRESTPGRYYLAEWDEPKRTSTVVQWIKVGAFWFLVLAIPMLLMRLAAGPH
jgi:hypothetical protein